VPSKPACGISFSDFKHFKNKDLLRRLNDFLPKVSPSIQIAFELKSVGEIRIPPIGYAIPHTLLPMLIRSGHEPIHATDERRLPFGQILTELISKSFGIYTFG